MQPEITVPSKCSLMGYVRKLPENFLKNFGIFFYFRCANNLTQNFGNSRKCNPRVETFCTNFWSCLKPSTERLILDFSQVCFVFFFFLTWSLQVKDWPKESYGKFYNGDSYIILHGEKDPDSNVCILISDRPLSFYRGRNLGNFQYDFLRSKNCWKNTLQGEPWGKNIEQSSKSILLSRTELFESSLGHIQD